MSRALMLASSRAPPKPGSNVFVQPTVCTYISRLSRTVAVWYAVDVLRARNRSSERMAMALMRRTAPACVSQSHKLAVMCCRTSQEPAEAKEQHYWVN